MRVGDADVHLRHSLDGHLFVPTPVVTPAGHARRFEDTEDWIKPKIRRVPITRISNITPLDTLGLPVWTAVTPLAKDLTTHTGKGRSHAAARLSAIMEAIERTSAEAVAPERIVRATHAELTASRPLEFGPVDPHEFNLPFDTRYSPNASFGWILAHDLVQKTHHWVPLDLVVNPPQEGICHGIETNGLASGNTLTEAALHGLHEVIERYSCARLDYLDHYGDVADRGFRPSRMIDVRTLPPDSLEWVHTFDKRGMKLTVRDETSELGVPVFAARLYDPEYPIEDAEDFYCVGFGADLSPSRAVLRAITETVQGHTGLFQGGRDAFEGEEFAERVHAWRREVERKQPLHVVPFEAAGAASADLSRDLSWIVQRLDAHGFRHCLAIDLTRADLGVPVVRILVPDMVTIDSRRRPALRWLAMLV